MSMCVPGRGAISFSEYRPGSIQAFPNVTADRGTVIPPQRADCGIGSESPLARSGGCQYICSPLAANEILFGGDPCRSAGDLSHATCAQYPLAGQPAA